MIYWYKGWLVIESEILLTGIPIRDSIRPYSGERRYSWTS